MGGNAVTNAQRMTVETFEAIKLQIHSLLSSTLSGVKFSFPVELGGKKSFGDLDVLLLSEDEETKHEILLMLNDNFDEVVESGTVYSVKYLDYQVDFILVDSDLDFATNYYSHGDLGNLLGYYAMHRGYKLGRDGLYISVNIPNVGKKRNFVTRDWRVALNMMGFESVEMPDSFPNERAMLNFVASSILFENKESVFNLSEVGSRYRSTVRKRPTQRLFFKEYLGYSDEQIDFVKKRK